MKLSITHNGKNKEKNLNWHHSISLLSVTFLSCLTVLLYSAAYYVFILDAKEGRARGWRFTVISQCFWYMEDSAVNWRSQKIGKTTVDEWLFSVWEPTGKPFESILNNLCRHCSIKRSLNYPDFCCCILVQKFTYSHDKIRTCACVPLIWTRTWSCGSEIRQLSVAVWSHLQSRLSAPAVMTCITLLTSSEGFGSVEQQND